MNQEEKEYQERYKMLKDKFRGISGMELIRRAHADKDDSDVFDELIRRFIRNIQSVYISNQDGYEDHETTSTQVRLTAFQQCVLNPRLLEDAADGTTLELEQDEDLGMIISKVIGELAPDIYQTVVDYRKLSDKELNNKKDDALASFVLSERMYQRDEKNTENLKNDQEASQGSCKTTRRIIKSSNLCLGGRLFTDEYVEIIKQNGRIVKQTKTQLKPGVKELFKSVKHFNCL